MLLEFEKDQLFLPCWQAESYLDGNRLMRTFYVVDYECYEYGQSVEVNHSPHHTVLSFRPKQYHIFKCIVWLYWFPPNKEKSQAHRCEISDCVPFSSPDIMIWSFNFDLKKMLKLTYFQTVYIELSTCFIFPIKISLHTNPSCCRKYLKLYNATSATYQ